MITRRISRREGTLIVRCYERKPYRFITAAWQKNGSWYGEAEIINFETGELLCTPKILSHRQAMKKRFCSEEKAHEAALEIAGKWIKEPPRSVEKRSRTTNWS